MEVKKDASSGKMSIKLGDRRARVHKKPYDRQSTRAGAAEDDDHSPPVSPGPSHEDPEIMDE
jgi:hypothetical protein